MPWRLRPKGFLDCCPHDAEAVADWGTAYEVHQGSVVIGMDAAGSPGSATGTGLQFRTESGHEGIEQDL